jgi:hypothetical protein
MSGVCSQVSDASSAKRPIRSSDSMSKAASVLHKIVRRTERGGDAPLVRLTVVKVRKGGTIGGDPKRVPIADEVKLFNQYFRHAITDTSLVIACKVIRAPAEVLPNAGVEAAMLPWIHSDEPILGRGAVPTPANSDVFPRLRRLIDVIHRQNRIHGDLKVDNVICYPVTREGNQEPMLIPFLIDYEQSTPHSNPVLEDEPGMGSGAKKGEFQKQLAKTTLTAACGDTCPSPIPVAPATVSLETLVADKELTLTCDTMIALLQCVKDFATRSPAHHLEPINQIMFEILPDGCMTCLGVPRELWYPPSKVEAVLRCVAELFLERVGDKDRRLRACFNHDDPITVLDSPLVRMFLDPSWPHEDVDVDPRLPFAWNKSSCKLWAKTENAALLACAIARISIIGSADAPASIDKRVDLSPGPASPNGSTNPRRPVAVIKLQADRPLRGPDPESSDGQARTASDRPRRIADAPWTCVLSWGSSAAALGFEPDAANTASVPPMPDRGLRGRQLIMALRKPGCDPAHNVGATSPDDHDEHLHAQAMPPPAQARTKPAETARGSAQVVDEPAHGDEAGATASHPAEPVCHVSLLPTPGGMTHTPQATPQVTSPLPSHRIRLLLATCPSLPRASSDVCSPTCAPWRSIYCTPRRNPPSRLL